MSKRQAWIDAWQALSDHTKDRCGAGHCRGMEYRPHRCCDANHCEFALEYAKEIGESLERTDHPELPLMGENGCVAPPHLRPMCTAHVCIISSIGFDIKDMDWTDRYFVLRNAADRLSWEVSEE